MQPWWIERLAEIVAVAAMIGIPTAIWFVGKLLSQLKRRGRVYLIALTIIGGLVVLIASGTAASMFLLHTHLGCNCGSGEDIFKGVLAMLGPLVIVGPIALVCWTAMLIRAPSARQE